MPAADMTIDATLVCALLSEQHRDLATMPVVAVDTGWDNCMFRLGSELAVRMPRREAAAQLAMHEQTWLPVLAPHLPLPIPTPVRAGRPGCGYPWHWSVVPWFEGVCADGVPLEAAQARLFASFLRALHRPAPETAPHNPRGVSRWSSTRAECESGSLACAA
jgi:aminoglycoside phosphotransferase (APT) family kinase protein